MPYVNFFLVCFSSYLVLHVSSNTMSSVQKHAIGMCVWKMVFVLGKHEKQVIVSGYNKLWSETRVYQSHGKIYGSSPDCYGCVHVISDMALNRLLIWSILSYPFPVPPFKITTRSPPVCLTTVSLTSCSKHLWTAHEMWHICYAMKPYVFFFYIKITKQSITVEQADKRC